ncbi:HNH endonuclease [Glutamicibacter bergerei]|uniref:HNH endonuclease n=2 Tax=Glutamicibacter TaxID=1742989 RepID=A0ABV9MPA6_9MICC|nr:hypothetical protein [Micrococcaceae bacterium]
METRPCFECENDYSPANKIQKFCSEKCRYRHRDRGRFVPCVECGEPLQRQSRQVVGVSKHQACRGGHGSPGEYRKGCRCDSCLRGQAERASEYRQRHFDEYGVWLRGDWIDPLARLAIYERDSWICQLCNEPVEKGAKRGDRMAPTLDHIIPRSLQLVPDHSDGNLRTAHHWCNSSRGNRV